MRKGGWNGFPRTMAEHIRLGSCTTAHSVTDTLNSPDRQDMHPNAFLSAPGLQYFLSMLDVGALLDPSGEHMPPPPDMRSFVGTMRRLHIPYYEEARRYFAAARDDAYFQDQMKSPCSCRAHAKGSLSDTSRDFQT